MSRAEVQPPSSPLLPNRQLTHTSDRLKAARAPDSLVNLALAAETHGISSWQHRVLALQRSRAYSIAFITLLLLDVCAAITALLLNTSFPECETVRRFASCETNSTVLLERGWNATWAEHETELQHFAVLRCDDGRHSSARLAEGVLAIFSICVLSIFVFELMVVVSALWKCIWRTSRFFRWLSTFDFVILTSALCIEAYLLSVGYPTAGDRGLQGSSPVLVLISRFYRYFQLARRSYALIGRVTRTHNLSTKGVLEKKAAIDSELEGYREQQLLARAEGTERVHPSKLVLQVQCMLLSWFKARRGRVPNPSAPRAFGNPATGRQAHTRRGPSPPTPTSAPLSP